VFKRFADWIIARAMRTPYFHLPGYMNRYWLLPYGRQIIAARIHEILRSDDDRAFHDHPWPYLTIILRGGYWETKPVYDKSGLYTGKTRKWYGPGSILFRPAKSYHILELPTGQTAWTLFITGKWRQVWGFMPNPTIKIPHHIYLEKQ
jgi:hypothetical protein